jgi:nucleotide-binding universal stress UspA family protein
MAFKRMLLLLRSYPTPTPASALGVAVDVAVTLGAKVSALSLAILPHVPKSILSGVIGDVPALVGQERQKITSGAEQLLQTFSELASQRGVLGEARYRKCAPSEVPDLLAGYARVNDLTVVPMPDGGYLDQLDSHWYLETALFDSGRPILVLPHGYHSPGAGAFGTVVVAWDHSAAAARALADAMPILHHTKSARTLTITNEKALTREPPPLEVVSYLAAHAIQSTYDAVDADGRDAATAIIDNLRARSGDLLVMGGYGHSRLRELVLGGATRHMLTHPPVPVLMSH